MVRTGRRRGSPDTREAILAAAREVFGQKGFDAASIRAIAAVAGCDPALVHHYFGSKDKLFLATVQAPIDPAEVVPRVLAGGLEGAGARLVQTLLGVWDDPVSGPAALALVRSALQHDWSARMLREFLTSQVLRRVVAQLAVDQAGLRTALVASQMFGLIGIRYVLRIEPLASAPAELVAASIGPTVDRYLTDPTIGADPALTAPAHPATR
jgi:AcrR family transcriptional regulator